jgi:hypothetical protein
MSTDSNEAAVQSVVHTPGPWVVRKRNPPSHGYLFGFHVGNSEQRTTVCEVVNEHDAKLIAAAPMMLAALRRIVQHQDIIGGSMASVSSTRHIAAQAIQHATGEQV